MYQQGANGAGANGAGANGAGTNGAGANGAGTNGAGGKWGFHSTYRCLKNGTNTTSSVDTSSIDNWMCQPKVASPMEIMPSQSLEKIPVQNMVPLVASPMESLASQSLVASPMESLGSQSFFPSLIESLASQSFATSPMESLGSQSFSTSAFCQPLVKRPMQLMVPLVSNPTEQLAACPHVSSPMKVCAARPPLVTNAAVSYPMFLRNATQSAEKISFAMDMMHQEKSAAYSNLPTRQQYRTQRGITTRRRRRSARALDQIIIDEILVAESKAKQPEVSRPNSWTSNDLAVRLRAAEIHRRSLPQGQFSRDGSQDPAKSALEPELETKERNRIASKVCRAKKKEYIRCLEERVLMLEKQNAVLMSKLNCYVEM